VCSGVERLRLKARFEIGKLKTNLSIYKDIFFSSTFILGIQNIVISKVKTINLNRNKLAKLLRK